MNERIIWTNLKPWQIGGLLEQKYDIGVSVKVIRKLLKKHGYRRRKAQKRTTKKNVLHRDLQDHYTSCRVPVY